LRDEILAIGADPNRPEAAFRVRFRAMFLGRWIRFSSLYPTWVVRLLKPERITFQRDINLRYVIDGPEGKLLHYFEHYSFNKGISNWWMKHNTYSTVEAREAMKVIGAGRSTGSACSPPITSAAALRSRTSRIAFRSGPSGFTCTSCSSAAECSMGRRDGPTAACAAITNFSSPPRCMSSSVWKLANRPGRRAMAEEIRSYTSLNETGAGSLRESFQLLRKSLQSSKNMADEVAHVLAVCRDAEALVIQQTDRPIANLDVLELGPGQLPRQTAYFALKNRVTAIDLDVIPRSLGSYLQLLRQNGPKRLLKTLGRKLLGHDRRFRSELRRQLHINALPRATLLQMDATKMSFPVGSFDFAYSFDTFEHFPDPAAVLRELHRVLRPSGRVLTVLHPWTADTGCHDMRFISPAARVSLTGPTSVPRPGIKSNPSLISTA
jgi:SAM-dependent methyltransferase